MHACLHTFMIFRKIIKILFEILTTYWYILLHEKDFYKMSNGNITFLDARSNLFEYIVFYKMHE